MTPRKRQVVAAPRILLSALVAFLLVQFAAGFVIDWACPEIRFPHLHDRLAKLRLEPRTPDVVFLGSSRFASALDSSELTHELRRLTGRHDYRAFNAAVPGGDLIVMERLLREMQRQGIRPAALVIETAPYSLLRVNGWYDMHIIRQLECSDAAEHGYEMTRSGNLGRFALSRFMPLYVHRYAVLKKLWAPAPPSAPEPIGLPNKLTEEAMARLLAPDTPVSDEQMQIASLGAEAMLRPYRDYEIGGASLRALERILDGCARQGTRVLLVGTPLSSAHRKLLTPEIDATYHGYLDGLAGRFGVPFVDCRGALPDSLMADHHHVLRPEGMTVFSRYLAREVLAPWLVERGPPIRFVNQQKGP